MCMLPALWDARLPHTFSPDPNVSARRGADGEEAEEIQPYSRLEADGLWRLKAEKH